MLARRRIRRYLLALLCSEEVIQSADCKVGKLWETCDDEIAPWIFDSDTHQINPNAEASQGLRGNCVNINIIVSNVEYDFCETGIDYSDVTFTIQIIVEDASGIKRQDILDAIEERIFYRIISAPRITDAQTGEVLKSFMTLNTKGEVGVKTFDDSNFTGDYTIREIECTLKADECIKIPNCDPKVICFCFDQLTKLDKPRPKEAPIEAEQEE